MEDGRGHGGLRYRYVLDMGQGSALLLLHDWTRSSTLAVRPPSPSQARGTLIYTYYIYTHFLCFEGRGPSHDLPTIPVSSNIYVCIEP